MKYKEIICDLKRIIPITFFFSFMLFFFAPYEIYLSNKGYFFFPGTDMLGITIAMTLGSWIILVLLFSVIRMINLNIFKILIGCFFGGSLALYLQGNWDTTDYGAWNGSDIDWSLFRIQLVIFVSLFVVLILSCAVWSILCHELFIKVSAGICSFVSLILVVTLGVLLVVKGGLSKDKEYICTTEEELSLSSNENMIILVLDAFDSSAFREIIDGSEGSQYMDMFKDFTYFPDTVTGYSSTDMSLPLIITGKGYKNDKLFGEFLDEAYNDSEFLSWLDSNDWERDIYTDSLMPQGNQGHGICNSKQLKRIASDKSELMYYMYTMVVFRYMPQPIKNHFYFYADNIKGNLNMVIGDYTPFDGNDLKFWNRIDSLSADKDHGVFQLFHIEGAHEPFTLTSNLNVVEESSYEEECIASLMVTDKLISALKNAEIYDDSVIIVMADHGYSNGRMNPLLLIKGKNEQHTFMISDMPVSYYDLQDAYIKLLESGTPAGLLFDNWDLSKERYYCTVPFNTHLGFNTYGGGMTEYVIMGHAWDASSASKTGKVYEEKELFVIK